MDQKVIFAIVLALLLAILVKVKCNGLCLVRSEDNN